MWNDQVRDRFWWAKIQSQMEELLYELSKAEDEEEIGLYLLTLHQKNERDLKYFHEKEQERIVEFLSKLIHETTKHKELLGGIVKELEEIKAHHAE